LARLLISVVNSDRNDGESADNCEVTVNDDRVDALGAQVDELLETDVPELDPESVGATYEYAKNLRREFRGNEELEGLIEELEGILEVLARR
jgi:hypothetical protein